MQLKCAIRNSLLLSALCFSAVTVSQAESGLDLSRLVVVGDSLSAGVQNFSLLDSQQVHGYAYVIAQQSGLTSAQPTNRLQFTLPLIAWPGAPNVLQLTGFSPSRLGPVPVVQPASGSLPVPPMSPRDNPCAQPTNLSVPGLTLEQALTARPSAASSTDPVQGWVNLVLGFPSPFAPCGNSSASATQIEQAITLNPTTVIEYLGNNDALVPALVGQLSMLTPLTTFATSYQTLLDKLQTTNAAIITATIPDVTKVPYFTPISVLAAKAGLATWAVAAKLGVGPYDYLRPTAVPIAQSILSGGPGDLTQPCAVSGSLPVPNVPCVLTQRDAITIQLTIDAYNTIIYSESIAHGATVVDVHALVDQIAQNGYALSNGRTLTSQFVGGLFSLDGVHPTNTGYGIIANEFIRVMRDQFGASIPFADVNAIASEDPLVTLSKLPTPAPPTSK